MKKEGVSGRKVAIGQFSISYVMASVTKLSLVPGLGSAFHSSWTQEGSKGSALGAPHRV